MVVYGKMHNRHILNGEYRLSLVGVCEPVRRRLCVSARLASTAIVAMKDTPFGQLFESLFEPIQGVSYDLLFSLSVFPAIAQVGSAGSRSRCDRTLRCMS